jgi:hypothetical protein
LQQKNTHSKAAKQAYFKKFTNKNEKTQKIKKRIGSDEVTGSTPVISLTKSRWISGFYYFCDLGYLLLGYPWHLFGIY